MKPQLRLAVVGLVVFFLLLVFAPQLLLTAQADGRIYSQVLDMPAREYGVVFGAYVLEDQSLSDAARERIEAAIQLYHQGKIQRLFISGDNRSNQQADAIAMYAQKHGVAASDIVVDRLGIDTHDTCRHFAKVASEGILITQWFHLPRAMYMCERDGVAVVGLAVNRLGMLAARGDNATMVYATRLSRFVRESLLTWLFILGVYDRVSNEAELLE